MPRIPKLPSGWGKPRHKHVNGKHVNQHHPHGTAASSIAARHHGPAKRHHAAHK